MIQQLWHLSTDSMTPINEGQSSLRFIKVTVDEILKSGWWHPSCAGLGQTCHKNIITPVIHYTIDVNQNGSGGSLNFFIIIKCFLIVTVQEYYRTLCLCHLKGSAFPLILTTLLLSESRGGCWSVSQLHMGEGGLHPSMSIRVFSSLLKGTSAVFLKVSWHLNWEAQSQPPIDRTTAIYIKITCSSFIICLMRRDGKEEM